MAIYHPPPILLQKIIEIGSCWLPFKIANPPCYFSFFHLTASHSEHPSHEVDTNSGFSSRIKVLSCQRPLKGFYIPFFNLEKTKAQMVGTRRWFSNKYQYQLQMTWSGRFSPRCSPPQVSASDGSRKLQKLSLELFRCLEESFHTEDDFHRYPWRCLFIFSRSSMLKDFCYWHSL